MSNGPSTAMARGAAAAAFACAAAALLLLLLLLLLSGSATLLGLPTQRVRSSVDPVRDPAAAVAPSPSSSSGVGRIVLTGLIEDGSSISLSSLKFVTDLTCLHGYDSVIYARRGGDDLHGMMYELRDELYPHLSGGMCPGRADVRSEPPTLRDDYPNRIDRVAALRDMQRRAVAEVLESSSSDDDESETIVVVADLDVAFLPPPRLVLHSARLMLSRAVRVRTRIDVLCSAGADVNGGYYDTFATVLIPDTFVYPVESRMGGGAWEGEDASLIVGSGGGGGIAPRDLLGWFDRVGGGGGAGGGGGGDGDGGGGEPVPVRSCFGGLALYRASGWLDSECSYSDTNELDVKYSNRYDSRPCEHVVLHNCMMRSDPLTRIAVAPGLRPSWHAGDGGGASLSAKENMDRLREDTWSDVDRRLREAFDAMRGPVLSVYNGAVCPSFDTTNATANGTNATNATDCCWDNTTEILLSERAYANSTNATTANMTRTYNLCPNTTYHIGDYDTTTDKYVGGTAALELSANVTVRCSTDGNVTDNCTLTGGTNQVRIVGGGEGNVTLRGITFTNSSGVNVLSEGVADVDVNISDCTFASNENGGVILIDALNSRLALTRCLFVGNALSAPAVTIGGGADLTDNCFEGNVVRRSLIASAELSSEEDEDGSSFSYSAAATTQDGNYYWGNEYVDEVCVAGVWVPGGEVCARQDSFPEVCSIPGSVSYAEDGDGGGADHLRPIPPTPVR